MREKSYAQAVAKSLKTGQEDDSRKRGEQHHQILNPFRSVRHIPLSCVFLAIFRTQGL